MLSRTPITQSVARKLQAMILNGELQPGEKIPSQRVLSETLKVSRASLREALMTIETLGLIKTEPGRGTFVTSNDHGGQAGAARWRYADSYSAREVFETRIMLESRIAGLAARNLPGDRLSVLVEATDEMEARWNAHDLLANVEADLRFHVAIAHGCGNAMLITLYEAVRELMAETQRQPIPMTAPGRMQESIAEHRAIIGAIAARDAAAAETAMAAHVRNTAACVGIIL